MGRPKKTEVKVDLPEPTEQAIEAPVSDEIIEVDEVVEEETKVDESTEESPEKKAFRAKVEAYKLSNPFKYEQKKEHFFAILRGMK